METSSITDFARKSPAEIIRDRIRPIDCLDKIHEVESIVQESWQVLTKNQIDALKLQSDIQFRKLLKVLPDLKATEHTMGDTASKVVFQINMGDKPHEQKELDRVGD